MDYTLNFQPLSDHKYDKLHFFEKSKQISDFISYFPPQTPYAISINGDWGTGKSTMLNFIEQFLKDDRNCHIIRFNPWMIRDSEELLKNLFEEIYEVIDGNFAKAKNSFKEYALKLMPTVGKVGAYIGAVSSGADPRTSQIISQATGESLQGVNEVFFGNPLSKQKQKVKEDLQDIVVESREKIVVMVDELDRLFPDEVAKVFQMIKSILDLPGLFFVVAMDNNVIFDSLQKLSIKDPNAYLQKIFQRNYLINSSFQLRTLTEEFLIKRINSDQEKHKMLTEVLECFVFLDVEKFVKLNGTENINGKTPERIEKEFQQKYYSLYQVLRKELENPRVYIKFVDYILEKWDSLFQYLKAMDLIKTEDLQSAFLTLCTYFKYPNLVNNEYSAYIYYSSTNNKNIPELVSRTNDMIKDFYPDIKEGNVTRTNNRTLSEIVFFLNGFPDFIRHRRVSESEM